MARRAGLLVRRAGELSFLPASVAKSLLPLPRLSKVPWDSAQMALVGGDVVAVLELAEPCGVLVLCELEGQTLALSGLSAERAGSWPESGTGVSVDGVEVPGLDLGAALTQFQRTAKDGAP
ncbi:MAG: hypothetical protein ABUL62_26375 [Myxococcales bacterium]|jgi:hypothetical protein